jgi:exodeoxyribonuclease-5
MTLEAVSRVEAHCAVCARPLTDPLSVELGIGPDCREQYGYDEAVEPAIRAEVNQIVYRIATTRDDEVIQDAANQLHDFGFATLAERVERRIKRRTAEIPVTEPEPAPEPAAAPSATDIPDAAQVALPFKLTEGQDRALAMVGRLLARVEPAVGFIVGFAGTGKTTMLRAIAQKYGRPIVVTPTGKAAMRVTEATGLEASTIHRWIYKAIENEDTGVIVFTRRYPDEIPVTPSRLVLLDEASMVGPEVWKDVWETCRHLGLKLVCVGDGFQLPPVQPPNAPPFSLLTPEFASSISAERVELTEVLRQAQDSPIVRASMALRDGAGLRAFGELPRIQTAQLGQVAVETYKAGGVVVCHRNVTRFKLNNGIRSMLGITNEYPQAGEPLLVLKNSYEIGLMNGETTTFGGWHMPPDQHERIYDRWKHQEEHARFGAILVGGKTLATIAVEELYGSLATGFTPIKIAASRWARPRDLYLGENVAPHLHVNFGYVYTCHKAQGSEWPYVLVILESSVRFDEEEGRRWAYTALTRGKSMAAVFLGSV